MFQLGYHLLGNVIPVVLGIGMLGVLGVLLDLGQEGKVIEVRLLVSVLVLEQGWEFWREARKGKSKV